MRGQGSRIGVALVRSDHDVRPPVLERLRPHIQHACKRSNRTDISPRALEVEACGHGTASTEIACRTLRDQPATMEQDEVIAHRLDFREIVAREKNRVLPAQ